MAATGVRGAKSAGVRPREIALTVGDRIGVVARAGRHKANAEEAAVERVREAFDGELLATGLLKLTTDADIRERVCRIRRGNVDGHFHKIVGFEALGRLRERNVARRGPGGA